MYLFRLRVSIRLLDAIHDLAPYLRLFGLDVCFRPGEVNSLIIESETPINGKLHWRVPLGPASLNPDPHITVIGAVRSVVHDIPYPPAP